MILLHSESMTLAADKTCISNKDNLAIPDKVVTADKSNNAATIDTRNLSNPDDNSTLDAKPSNFRHPSTRNELASYYLHFMGPKPFYKSYSYV